jgi:AAA+ ATPase superfamily predicted ATPase
MPKTSYVGRTKELNLLNGLLEKKSSSLVVLKGRRRVGKSRLVEEFGRNHRFIKFSGLSPTPGITKTDQQKEFMHLLSLQTGFPEVMVDDWSKAFSLLASQTQTGQVIILLDEISWMAEGSPDFLPKLKNAWDLSFKNNSELILILCGSISSWIDENILASTGFMGRISLSLEIQPLSIRDSSALIKSINPNLSAIEQLEILAITGGIPRYIEEILPNAPAIQTIIHCCFKKEGILFREFEDIFSDLFSRKSPTYIRILEALLEGKFQFHALCEQLELEKSGSVLNYLNDLSQAGFIQKDTTWDLKSQKKMRFSQYRISDNYIRFYLKFILPNKHKIESDLFQENSIKTLPNWNGIMGLQFENLVLQNRALIWEALRISPSDIAMEGPFLQRAKKSEKDNSHGCQIDYLIQTQYNTLFPCEIKFSAHSTLGLGLVQEMTEKVERLRLPKNYSYWPVLIYAGEISEDLASARYFKKIIHFSEFLK